MGVLLIVALLLVIPTKGLSLLPVLGAVALRAWAQGAATRTLREQQNAPPLPAPQRAASRGVPSQVTAALPTWARDASSIERFRSDLYDALPRRGVPRSYVAMILSTNEVTSLALASARTAEENGKDFYRQGFASADFIVRRWNGLLPLEQKIFQERHY
jgi:hypothetical protein